MFPVQRIKDLVSYCTNLDSNGAYRLSGDFVGLSSLCRGFRSTLMSSCLCHLEVGEGLRWTGRFFEHLSSTGGFLPYEGLLPQVLLADLVQLKQPINDIPWKKNLHPLQEIIKSMAMMS